MDPTELTATDPISPERQYLSLSVTARFLIGCLLVASASSVGAQPARDERPGPSFNVEIGYGQTDNLGRRASSEIRSDITTLGLAFGLTADRRRLDGRIVGDVDWRHYGADEVRDDQEAVGSVDGALSLHAVPDIFIWDFFLNQGQTRTDPLAPVGPDNRDQTKVVTIGPRVALPIGERNRLDVSARKSERSYRDSGFLDSEMSSVNLGFSHALDSVTDIALTFEQWETDYDDSPQSYEYESISLAYTRDFASGGMEFSLGRGEIDFGMSGDPRAVGRIAWDRDIAARSRIRLWLSKEYTDAGELFRLGGVPATRRVSLSAVPGTLATQDEIGSSELGLNETRLNSVVQSADPALRSTAGLQLSLTGRRIDVGISFETAENKFVTGSTLSSDLEIFSVSASREIGGQWRVGVGVTFLEEDFSELGVNNGENDGAITLTRLVGRQSTLSIRYGRSHRGSGINQFEENVYRISFGRRVTR